MGSASVAAEVTASRTYVDATQAANSYDTRIDPVPACGSGTAATCETITGCAWGASRSLPACLPACRCPLGRAAAALLGPAVAAVSACICYLLLLLLLPPPPWLLAAGCWLALPSLRFFQRCVFSLTEPPAASVCLPVHVGLQMGRRYARHWSSRVQPRSPLALRLVSNQPVLLWRLAPALTTPRVARVAFPAACTVAATWPAARVVKVWVWRRWKPYDSTCCMCVHINQSQNLYACVFMSQQPATVLGG